MLQQRKWIDQNAEAEFWAKMERLEAASEALARTRGWRGVLGLATLRRAGLARDVATLRASAEDLVRLHTVPIDTYDSAPATVQAPGSDALRTLAGLAVSLRQDRDGSDGLAQESGAP